MAVDRKSRAALRIALTLLATLPFTPNLLAQTSQKPCTSNCPPETQQTVKPSNAEQFPFPKEDSKSAGNPTPPDAPAPSPQTKSPAPTSTSPFPYPGETPTPDNSSSSSSSSSPDADPDPDKPPVNDAEKSPRRRLPKVKKLQSDEERESEDITVARFYRDRGNWNAAYQRSKDAVKHQPDDPDAHLLLAETAQKLEKRDEAIAEYTALLKLDASEDQIKAAHKALTKLNPPAK